ncbi:hypothetical protein G6M89_20860 [Natronolimnobius sp. AArcel1]|uniref:hypothetical protein n=1 Tax=Natronolimnobius sp. AArcel1 TaxID=1679093 RepID=UPI0013EAB28E|nr:hypothetical protein [Natronolimnobius sp. AArcel1]NGM71413.1 hypothetical protein [Natronolimnobius sp. AArcel1]
MSPPNEDTYQKTLEGIETLTINLLEAVEADSQLDRTTRKRLLERLYTIHAELQPALLTVRWDPPTKDTDGGTTDE